MKHKALIKDLLDNVWNEKAHPNESSVYSSISKNLIINSPLGKKVGLDNMIDINNQWMSAFPDMQVKIHQVDSYGDVIISSWTTYGTHKRAFRDIPPCGKKIAYDGETTFFFQNEKIVRYSCKVDLDDVYSQLGFFYKKEEYPNQRVLFKSKQPLIDTLAPVGPEKLTSREAQSLSLYLIGFNASQIGKILYISPRTVETHIQRSLHRLGCSSKQDCLEMMLESSLLPLWQDLGKLLVYEYECKKKHSVI